MAQPAKNKPNKQNFNKDASRLAGDSQALRAAFDILRIEVRRVGDTNLSQQWTVLDQVYITFVNSYKGTASRTAVDLEGYILLQERIGESSPPAPDLVADLRTFRQAVAEDKTGCDYNAKLVDLRKALSDFRVEFESWLAMTRKARGGSLTLCGAPVIPRRRESQDLPVARNRIKSKANTIDAPSTSPQVKKPARNAKSLDSGLAADATITKQSLVQSPPLESQTLSEEPQATVAHPDDLLDSALFAAQRNKALVKSLKDAQKQFSKLAARLPVVSHVLDALEQDVATHLHSLELPGSSAFSPRPDLKKQTLAESLSTFSRSW